MALEQWAPRALEQKGDNPTKTIQLTSDGVLMETWGSPLPDEAAFLEQARAVLAQFAEESPKGKRVPVLFTAIGTDGNPTTQCPSSYIGKNSQADALVGSGNGAAKAFADSMALQVTSMNVLLTAGYKMVEAQTKANESLVEQLVDMREYIKAIHEAEIDRLAKLAEATPSGQQLPEVVREQLTAMLPLAQEAAGFWLESLLQKKKAPTPATAPVAQVTNGVSTS